jgi:tetratricopeptide (TPR) repeat protein
MSGDFVFDDIDEIEQNPHIKTLTPLSEPLGAYHTLPVRPLPYLTFALNYAAHGLAKPGYHVVNILIHLACGYLVYGIMLRTLRRYFAGRATSSNTWTATEQYVLALICAGLFLVHPLQTQAVSYIYQRIELMVSLFLLLTLYCFVRGVEGQGSRKWLGLSIFSCWCGMLCKEVMFVAPLLVVAYDWIFICRSKSLAAPQKFRLPYYLLLISSWGLLAGLIIQQSQGYGEFSGQSHPRWNYLLSQSWVILHYLRLVVYPVGQVLDYYWIPVQGLSESLPASLIVAVGFLLTIYGVIRQREWSIIGIWFYLCLAPSSSFVPVIALCVEHRMYLAIIAPIVAIVFLTYELLRRAVVPEKSVQILVAVALLCGGVLCSITYARNAVYDSRITMWEDVRLKQPDDPYTYWYLGKAYHAAKDFPYALDVLETGLTKKSLVPGNENSLKSKMHNEVGLLYAKSRDSFPQAIAHYQAAIQLLPGNAEANNNLGVVYFKLGDARSCYQHFAAAIKLKPDFVDAQKNMEILQEAIREATQSKAQPK